MIEWSSDSVIIVDGGMGVYSFTEEGTPRLWKSSISPNPPFCLSFRSSLLAFLILSSFLPSLADLVLRLMSRLILHTFDYLFCSHEQRFVLLYLSVLFVYIYTDLLVISMTPSPH